MTGEELRIARAAAGMSQSELAELAGLSRPTIARLEGGTSTIDQMSVENAKRLANALRVPIGKLINE